jgi:DNA-binding MarR family transcriptional regulator
MTRERVLRALLRFDVATVDDLAEALGSKPRIWAHLKRAVEDGLVEREGDHKRVGRYRITDAGRKKAA